MIRDEDVKMSCLLKLTTIVLIWSALFTAAPAAPQDDIESIYRQTYKAAGLKYRAGMYVHRDSEFRAYDVDGLEVDPQEERAWLHGFLDRAIAVSESGKIVKFKMLSGAEAECEIVDTIEGELFSDFRKREVTKVRLVTRSLDSWRLTRLGWKLVASHILEQDYSVITNESTRSKR